MNIYAPNNKVTNFMKQIYHSQFKTDQVDKQTKQNQLGRPFGYILNFIF